MKRKAYDSLLDWKHRKTKQALLVTGARQVGKTYLIRQFGAAEYRVFIEFNLLLDTSARASFAAATSPQDLALRISIAASQELVAGETLVFFDEVQACPEIVTLIKGLVDEGLFDYILSGSLLGVELKNVRSLPVGYMRTLTMHPMDFEEFCWAAGLSDEAFSIMRECFESKAPVPEFIHDRLMGIFHRY